MIECYDKNIWYNSRRKKKKKFKLKFLFLLLFLIIFYFYYKKIVVYNVFDYVLYKNESIISDCINYSIFDSSNKNFEYNNIVKIEKDKEGNIIYIESDSKKINNISSNLGLKIKNEINNKIREGVDIPLFAFTGLSSISGYGPKIKFKSLSIDKVDCNIKSEFDSSGVNQTIHKIYLEIKSVYPDFEERFYDASGNIYYGQTSSFVGKNRENQ